MNLGTARTSGTEAAMGTYGFCLREGPAGKCVWGWGACAHLCLRVPAEPHRAEVGVTAES